MNGIPITMLNGLGLSLGCPDCGGTCLGAVPIDEVKKFFIGPNKYVKSTKSTPVYKAAGEAPYKTVSANDTIGKVVNINSKGNWGILENGDWILLSDSMYTVYLTVPPPTSISDAVGRELEKIPFLPSAATLKLILWAGIIIGGAVIVSRFVPAKTLAIK